MLGGEGRIKGSIFIRLLLPTQPFTNLHPFTQAAASPGCRGHPQPGQGRRPSRSRASSAKWLRQLKPTFCSISESSALLNSDRSGCLAPLAYHPKARQLTLELRFALAPWAACALLSSQAGRQLPERTDVCSRSTVSCKSPTAGHGLRRQPRTLIQPSANSTAARGC